MADNYSMSYSISTDTPQATPAEQPVLYAIEEYDSFTLPEGVLITGKDSGARLVVSPEVASVLPHCHLFRSLDEHARFLVAKVPALRGSTDDVLRVLEMLQQAGLLISAASVCERMNTAAVAAAGEPASSRAFIITCDRPEALARLLESMLKGASLSRHQGLYLIDDSRDSDNAARNEVLVQNFSRTSPVAMKYIGAVQQAQLQQQLTEELPLAEAAIDFLIGRERWAQQASYGLSRTLCLLLSVGHRCLMMDDDVLCEALFSPGRSGRVKFVEGIREADFYADEQGWRREGKPTGFDPLTGHLRLLGKTLSQAAGELSSGVFSPSQCAGCDPKIFSGLKADSPILVTQCGSFGDPGTGSDNWLLYLGARFG